MNHKLLHTPEGVRDIYNGECAKKNVLQGKLKELQKSYGYEDIQTPMFEFFDIFNTETGTVSSKDMYKFFDREGNTLVLRPDITPSIARVVAKCFGQEQVPLRFSYMGNTFINNSSLQGLMKETTQIGAELVGDDSTDADGELVALAIHMLLESGLTQFQLNIGHVGFFNGIVEESGMDDQLENELRSLIESKNYFGVEELVNGLPMKPGLKSVFLKLPEMFGTKEVLETAKGLTTNSKALKAIERLEKVYDVLDTYGVQKYVTFDLGMLTEYNYYTGIIFRGYTYGTGDAIVKGGRSDHLIGQFGKDSASVGFALVVDRLMIALSRQKIDIPITDEKIMLLYPGNLLKQAVGLAKQYRREGIHVAMVRKAEDRSLEQYEIYAKNHQIQKILYMETDGRTEEIEVKI